ncbi:elongation factor Tu domain 2 protein [Methanohalobium evestigatum Z-7303]|uniref:Elongation factor Tu domain 2 protein n=1 Tax=Methanohalobium evestigatum (strain ATCC BAA-1072 / DSM 3721 / NBRC 107634 / OCM 161 / Z-7303) TaxID=644295 RepID=D7E5S8_METEZ|nr:EF-Tu/IF-2/RF-3 family GTPase [Methanohalobium evestigatum]ADI72950.1 elongation factor Tu domain 2 protein [Methanohalobium evestigatum Z-7303]
MTSVAIIGSEQSGRTSLASHLGKKEDESDITKFEYSKGGRILTAIDANGYPESVKPLITALSLSDIALICVPPEGLNATIGECIIALDIMKYQHGIFVLTKSDTTYPYAIEELKEQIKKVTAGTSLENWDCISTSTTSFEGMNELRDMIFELRDTVTKEKKSLDDKPPRVVIDQVFNVTGIGCVALGSVSQGTIHSKDKMYLYPLEKPLEIRSIQMHDEDTKSAGAGSRVGLALKHVQTKEIDRGFIISNDESVGTDFTLNCTLTQLTDGFAVGDVLHLFTGLQSTPVRVENITSNSNNIEHAKPGYEYLVEFSGTKEIAYNSSDRFIIANLNNDKQRFIGYGFVNA